MSEEAADLPPLLAEIADAAGVDAALAIARRHGGTRVTVPSRPDGENWLTGLVSEEQAAAIIEALGSARRIDVPLGPEGGYYMASRLHRERLYAELERGETGAADIARRMGITERAVRKRRGRRRAHGQGELPF